MSNRWLEQKERGTPFALSIIVWVARHLGRGSARLLLYPITLYFLLFAARARRASAQYLTRVYGRRATWWQVARHIHTFAATILDRLFFLSGRFDLFDIRLHGLEQLVEYAEAGTGCLLLGAHLGSFEVMRAVALQRENVRVKVLMYPAHNEYLTNLFNALNPAIAETVIPLGKPDSLLRVKEALDEGIMVGMLGDRVAESNKSVSCHFLGGQADFPAGPMLLAMTLQVPVMLVFGLYRGGNRYDLHFEPLTEGIEVPRSEREQALLGWTCEYAKRLETRVKSSPYNWFNFYAYWQDDK
jgi:predicted LPLAT superfamily acyltransferase